MAPFNSRPFWSAPPKNITSRRARVHQVTMSGVRASTLAGRISAVMRAPSSAASVFRKAEVSACPGPQIRRFVVSLADYGMKGGECGRAIAVHEHRVFEDKVPINSDRHASFHVVPPNLSPISHSLA